MADAEEAGMPGTENTGTAADPETIEVDITKHPSGIIPTLQCVHKIYICVSYTKKIHAQFCVEISYLLLTWDVHLTLRGSPCMHVMQNIIPR